MHTRNDTPILNFSVAKAFAILEYLASIGGARDLGVISRAVGMHKSTAYRFLSTLNTLGYVSQDPETSRYSLGSKVVWLASTFLDSLDLRTLARPMLEQLVEDSRETVHLAILDIRMVDDNDEGDISGILLAKDNRYKRVPKIFVTGFPTFEAVREAYGPVIGGEPIAHAFLAKKEGPHILIDAVNSTFE
ncbi:MAG: helix-turn-helix domain-containing protein, partial [Anaerolineales bacterium]